MASNDNTEPTLLDWQFASTLVDPEKMFVLWLVRDAFCRHAPDFRRHYGDTFDIEGVANDLKRNGCLQESSDGNWELTEFGDAVATSLEATPLGSAWQKSRRLRHLVRLAKVGDRAALGELLEQLSPVFIHIGSRFFSEHPQEIEDAVGFMNVKVIEAVRKGTIAEDKANLGYFYRLAENVCRDSVRELRKKGLTFSDVTVGCHAEADLWQKAMEYADIERHDMWSRSQASAEQVAEVWRTAKTILDEQNFQIFEMRHERDMKLREIAGVVGIVVSAVRTRLQQAYDGIRRRLESDGFAPNPNN